MYERIRQLRREIAADPDNTSLHGALVSACMRAGLRGWDCADSDLPGRLLKRVDHVENRYASPNGMPWCSIRSVYLFGAGFDTAIAGLFSPRPSPEEGVVWHLIDAIRTDNRSDRSVVLTRYWQAAVIHG